MILDGIRRRVFKDQTLTQFAIDVEKALQTLAAAIPFVMFGSINPNGVVSANAGTIYVRTAGASSNVYQNRSATDPGTSWTAL